VGDALYQPALVGADLSRRAAAVSSGQSGCALAGHGLGATAAVAVVGTVPMVVFPGMLPRPDLRHTVASLLIAGGANITFLSRQLGHSSSQITLTVYAHLLDGEAQAERTREMLQEMLGDVV
jgi:hypothetical protein